MHAWPNLVWQRCTSLLNPPSKISFFCVLRESFAPSAFGCSAVRLFDYDLTILQVDGIAACSALISRTTRKP